MASVWTVASFPIPVWLKDGLQTPSGDYEASEFPATQEGIRKFDNCVQCHRSANKHEGQGRERGREGRDDDRTARP
jgi:hypothetical protein